MQSGTETSSDSINPRHASAVTVADGSNRPVRWTALCHEQVAASRRIESTNRALAIEGQGQMRMR